MTSAERERFDRLLQQVLDGLPPELNKLLEEVPLVVDDEPDEQTRRRVKLQRGMDLCGLYTGIPLTRRSVEHSGVMPDVIRIFRGGVTRASGVHANDTDLLRQIRITVLHEMGHHFGLNEADLRTAGYG